VDASLKPRAVYGFLLSWQGKTGMLSAANLTAWVIITPPPRHSFAAELADVAHSLAVATARDLHARQIRVIANRPFAYAENDSGDPRRQDCVVGQRVEAFKRLMEIVCHWQHLPEIGFGADLNIESDSSL